MVIRLDLVKPEHADSVQALASDSVLAETTNLPNPYPPDGAERWVARATAARNAGTDRAYVIVDSPDVVVGVCSINEIDPVEGTAVIGYWVGRQYWNRGYETAACAELVRIASSELGLKRLTAPVLEHNESSRRVLQKSGFKQLHGASQHLKGTLLLYEWRADQRHV